MKPLQLFPVLVVFLSMNHSYAAESNLFQCDAILAGRIFDVKEKSKEQLGKLSGARQEGCHNYQIRKEAVQH
jgi:hypothetical protein